MSEQARRPYGTGSLFIRRDRHGREIYYGKWRTNGQQLKRSIGPKRLPGTRDGLTQKQAETELRRLMTEARPTPPIGERITVEDVSRRYIAHAGRRGRKKATITAIESETRNHLAPFFREKALKSIRPADVQDLVSTLERKGLAPKSIRNVVGTLSAFFNFARAPNRGWASSNPCEGVELPAVPQSTDIRYLTVEEVDALIAAAYSPTYAELDRVLYRVASMTGLRLGELVALRWRDIDWAASRIRVRRNYVLGEFGTPKSRRSTRSVPMAVEVAGTLKRLFQRSARQADDDLVFSDPLNDGEPLDKSNVTRRMRGALRRAGLNDDHVFHDLRHTFGTRMAAAGVPMRTLMEWMGHRDINTTLIYADFAPGAKDAELVAAAFDRGTNPSESTGTQEH